MNAITAENWDVTQKVKIFISHISQDKAEATLLKERLEPNGIAAFVAHEEIAPSSEWQQEIERALRKMDALLAIHTKGFSKSAWTQQEIGFAVARRVPIVSVHMGEDPEGFPAKHQAIRHNDRDWIVIEILGVLNRTGLLNIEL